jgi:NADPH:quinone reductase and related Zn-dependent oxidoreductases
MTAHGLAHSIGDAEAGDWVLVHAAAGGVGLLLTQMLARRGVRVIATTSSDEKADPGACAGAESSSATTRFLRACSS